MKVKFQHVSLDHLDQFLVRDLRVSGAIYSIHVHKTCITVERGGGTITDISALSFGLNFVFLYFLETCWTRLVICCFMEI